MAKYKVLVLIEGEPSHISESASQYFDIDLESELEAIPSRLSECDYKVVVYDLISSSVDMRRITRLLKMEETIDLPVVILSSKVSIQDKLDALEIGCDDFIDASVTADEACARITKSIYHRVAAEQLSSRLELANQTAHSALIDNSDLGANIQFLLAVHDCDNLDQLGQLFFVTMERYGLKSSLQMRSGAEVKNMEAHGMHKDLESQLLLQLKDSDRYIDFGSRTIINYECVSLLIKNMPVNEPDKYGAIKDNVFALVQGVNARIFAITDHSKLLEEREVLKKLSSNVRTVMQSVQQSYQDVMKEIADEVELTSEALAIKMPSFALTEGDEQFIEATMDRCVHNTTHIFNKGLKVDEAVRRLEVIIEQSLMAVDIDKDDGIESCKKGDFDNSVQLF